LFAVHLLGADECKTGLQSGKATMCLLDTKARDQISQAFLLCNCILQAIKDRGWEQPGARLETTSFCSIMYWDTQTTYTFLDCTTAGRSKSSQKLAHTQGMLVHAEFFKANSLFKANLSCIYMSRLLTAMFADKHRDQRLN